MNKIKTIIIGALTAPLLALGGGLAYASTTPSHPAQARATVTATAQHPAGQMRLNWCDWRYSGYWNNWHGHGHGYGHQPQPAHQRSHHTYRHHHGYRHNHGYQHRGGYSTGGNQGYGYQGNWGNGGSRNYPSGWGHGGGSHQGNRGGGCGHGW